MILGYAKLEGAEQKVLNGTKITSIRDDNHERWKCGRTIQHSVGVRTKKYRKFMENVCTAVQTIVIDYETKKITIDNMEVDEVFLKEQIARCDGFDSLADFWEFFKGKSGKQLKLIHWTDSFLYIPYDMNGLPF